MSKTLASYRRRMLLTAATAGICAVAVWLSSTPAAAEKARAVLPTRPNVLLIVIDTLRADHLSAYGYERETSPHLDRLAKEGLLYESCISAASWTLPGHASLFTGLFPRDHHTTSEHWTLGASFDTLAERLQAAGYDTAGFSNNVWTNDQSGLKQGFDHFEEMFRRQVVRGEGGISLDDPELDMGAAATNQEVLAWLEGREDGEAPFFVFINFFEPHIPYRPPKPFDRRFLPDDADDETVRRLRSFYTPREYGYILRNPMMRVSGREIEILEALYDAEIAYSDWNLDRLLEAMREQGWLDDTLVVVTSDHGEHLGENHMLSHKLSVYEPLLKVPMILWAPGRIPAGRRVRTQVQAHDVFGTILETVGLETTSTPLPQVDRPLAYTFAELDHPRIFIEAIHKKIPGWPTKDFERALKAVRSEEYKLIWGADGRHELYHVATDPLETKNLAASEPAIVQELLEVLQAFNEGSEPQPYGP